MFEQKLNKQQKDEIFREYLTLDTTAEQRGYATMKAKELGVAHVTIQRIIHDKKRMKEYLDKVNAIRDEQMARMWAHAGDAVDVHLDIIKNKRCFGENMAGVPQQSANALLDRIGLKAQKEDNTQAVTFAIDGGLKIGMPKGKKQEAQ